MRVPAILLIALFAVISCTQKQSIDSENSQSSDKTSENTAQQKEVSLAEKTFSSGRL